MADSIILGNLRTVSPVKQQNIKPKNIYKPTTKIVTRKPEKPKPNNSQVNDNDDTIHKHISGNFTVVPCQNDPLIDRCEKEVSMPAMVSSTKITTHKSNNMHQSSSNMVKVENNKLNLKTTYQTPKLFDESILQDIEQIETLQVDTKHEDLFSEVKFSQLDLDSLVVACLKQRFNLETATQVQALSIPILVQGKDALIKSATGSGKTLAYSIPIIHSLQALLPKIERSSGIHSLIILPTRELALQTYQCIDLLLQPFRRIVLGMLVGGEKKKSEKARIRKGLNILVATPGRLLDHLVHTNNLRLNNLHWLIIDEADRLYEAGFSAAIGQIMERIQNETVGPLQTVLLSATLSKGVKELAGLSLKNPELVDVGDNELRLEHISLPSSLENCFMVLPAKLRLVMLFSLLVKSLQMSTISKIIVFMSCQDVVDYMATLLKIIVSKLFVEPEEDINWAILQLRGNMNQNERTQTFKKFHDTSHGVLFCTDVVSRGLDLPNVDLVVQMSVPPLVEDYVHRVGRTARMGNTGRSVLMLLPSEIKYIPHLQQAISVQMTPLKLDQYLDAFNKVLAGVPTLHTNQERLAHLQYLLEETILKDPNLHQLAVKAYLSHLRAYASYPHKMSYCLPFKELHLGHIAKSFALRESPSELGANFHRNRKNLHKIKDTGYMKRKAVPSEERCSEFGGLISNKKNKTKT